MISDLKQLDYFFSNIYTSVMNVRLFLFIATFTLLFAWSFAPVLSATPGVALQIPLDNLDVKPGHIISFSSGDYGLSNSEFDTYMLGVVVDNPVASIDDLSLPEGSVYLSSSGEAKVLVSGSGGEIKKGDYITSSDIPGHGKKADQSGYVLGVALENFSGSTVGDVGTINVHIDIKSAYIDSSVKSDLLYFLRTGGKAPFLTPITSLRYLLAALIIVGSFVVAFATFGRTSGKGIEALGRNPLAKSAIRLTIVMNFFLTFLIMLIGLFLAYLILTL